MVFFLIIFKNRILYLEWMVYFGTSGIRGVYGKAITERLASKIGSALNDDKSIKRVAIGMDPRESGPSLKQALINATSEKEFLDFGMAPTPIVCYGTKKNRQDIGIMITASHNPPEYNGFKFWDNKGMAFTREMEKEIENRLNENKEGANHDCNKDDDRLKLEKTKESKENKPHLSTVHPMDMIGSYLEEIKNMLDESKLKHNKNAAVFIDPANGAASNITSRLIKGLGFRTTAINDIPDGTFPNRNPEPNAHNLSKTLDQFNKGRYDIGFCHDGDADRMIPIDEKGRLANFDRFLAFLSQKMVEQSGIKKIVTTVDASMLIDDVVDATVIRTRVGDVFVAQELEKTNACFGGEPSGSFIFPEFGLWPDGIFAAAKTLEMLGNENDPLGKILDRYPEYHCERTRIRCPEEKKEKVMDSLKHSISEKGEVSTIDGIHIRFDGYAILIRPSGTEPYLRLNVESKDTAILKKEKEYWLSRIKEELKNA